MTVAIYPVTIRALFEAEGFEEVCAAYCAESNRNGSLAGAAPDRERYEALESANLLFALGAFDGEQLVGLAVVLVTPVLHFESKKVATTESIFLLPAYRKGGAGANLLSACKDLAEFQGCSGLYVSAPVGGRLERVLPRAGFAQTNSVFYCEFDGGSL